MEHQLKITQYFLLRIMSGQKQFDVRLNDRDFQVGDIINYLPLESDNYNCYAEGKTPPHVKITYVHSGIGLLDKYVVLGLEPLTI